MHGRNVVHGKVSEHQKQSNRKMNFRLKLFSLLTLPLPLPEFQVPRKAVFYHHQGNKKPLNPPKQMRQKPTEPTSPSQLPALLSSALPDRPWEKVACPPPHQPQCANVPLFVHIKANSAPFFSRCWDQESNEMFAKIQPDWEMLWFHFICGLWWFDFNLWSDSHYLTTDMYMQNI